MNMSALNMADLTAPNPTASVETQLSDMLDHGIGAQLAAILDDGAGMDNEPLPVWMTSDIPEGELLAVAIDLDGTGEAVLVTAGSRRGDVICAFLPSGDDALFPVSDLLRWGSLALAA
jgi:hypothetical protein